MADNMGELPAPGLITRTALLDRPLPSQERLPEGLITIADKLGREYASKVSLADSPRVEKGFLAGTQIVLTQLSYRANYPYEIEIKYPIPHTEVNTEIKLPVNQAMAFLNEALNELISVHTARHKSETREQWWRQIDRVLEDLAKSDYKDVPQEEVRKLLIAFANSRSISLVA